jgi:uncharacterized membrane protein YgcG
MTALIPAVLPSAFAIAQETPPEPESVSLGTTVGIAFFLLVAALIVVSVLCKLVVAFGLVPRRPTARWHRVILWLANVVGEVRTVRGSGGRRQGSSSSSRGGGGSSGGAGASGEF